MKSKNGMAPTSTSLHSTCIGWSLFRRIDAQLPQQAACDGFGPAPAQASLQTFLEDVYNAKRLLSSLDCMPPDEFELKYAMCYHLSGLDFLGALQAGRRQLLCAPSSGASMAEYSYTGR